MSAALLVMLWVVATSATIAYGFAGHDAQAARRFRELSARTVAGNLDRRREAAWHTFGAWLRFGVCGLIAAIAALLLDARWDVLVLAWLLSGLLVAAGFDVVFNLKVGLPWQYVGETSALDQAVGASNGVFWTLMELVGAAVVAVIWLLVV